MAFPVDFVIVRESNVERILLRPKCSRPVAVCARGWFGVIETSVIDLPLSVPRAGVVWGGVFGRGGFTDPEYSGGDVLFPRVGLLFEWVLRSSWRRESLSRCNTSECVKK